jgi:hypothetical protein
MKKLLLVAAVFALTAAPALAETASKDGTEVDVIPTGVEEIPTLTRADFEFNTGGYIDFVPTTGGSHDGWGEWFITTVYNDTGNDLLLVEFGFPCCGPCTGDYGWLVWTDVGGMIPPGGDAYTAEYYGGPWCPDDSNPDTFPPTDYTYLDMSAEGIVIPAGNFFCFGYDVTGNGGQTDYNGYNTWAWYSGYWDPDMGWGRTAILQVFANYGGVSTGETTWGSVKALFR